MMNLDRKSLPDMNTGSSSRQLKILVIGSEQTEIIDVQTALARVPGIGVEAVPTLARLAIALQKGGARPDLVLVDFDADDVTLLRNLRKVSGLEDVPVIALTDRKAVHAPLRAIRAGANDVLFKPVDPNEAREVFSRVIEMHRAHRHSHSKLGKAMAFMHLSGGAGATTLAVNAACALAKMAPEKQTCLLDLDIQFGNAANLLDLPTASPVQEFIDDPNRLDESLLESMMLRHQTGLQVFTAPRALLPLTAYGPEGIHSLVDVARHRFGNVIIDLPVALAPWTDSVLKAATVIYLVASSSIPSAHRLVKFFDLLNEEGVRDLPIKLVINRHNRSSNRANDITVAQFEQATARKVDYTIPNDYSLISMSHGQGRPAVRLKPNSPFTVALMDMLGAELGNETMKRKKSFFSFGRM
jgi:pilus assembly protein CpaE